MNHILLLDDAETGAKSKIDCDRAGNVMTYARVDTDRAGAGPRRTPTLQSPAAQGPEQQATHETTTRVEPPSRRVLLRRLGALVVGAASVVLAVIAAHAWAAYGRSASDGVALVSEIVWSSVWLWLAMVGTVGIAYGCALAWSARHDQERLEARFRREGVR